VKHQHVAHRQRIDIGVSLSSFSCSHSERKREPLIMFSVRDVRIRVNMTALKKRRPVTDRPANCNHLAIGHVIVSRNRVPRREFRFSIPALRRKLLELFIGSAPRPQQRPIVSNIQIGVPKPMGATFPSHVSRSLCAVLAEMHVRNRTDEINAWRSREFGSKMVDRFVRIRLRNHVTPVAADSTRPFIDLPLRHKITLA